MKDLKIKLILIILAAVLASGSYLYILHVGKEYRYVNNAFRSDNELKIVDIISDDGGEIEILGFQQTEKGYTADLRAKTPGHVFIYVSGDEGIGSSFFLTVHKNGVITQGGFLGDCTGFGSVIICLILYLLLVAAYFVKKYIDQSKKTLYGYDNISYCGLAVFAVFFALAQIRALGSRTRRRRSLRWTARPRRLRRAGRPRRLRRAGRPAPACPPRRTWRSHRWRAG